MYPGNTHNEGKKAIDITKHMSQHYQHLIVFASMMKKLHFPQIQRLLIQHLLTK